MLSQISATDFACRIYVQNLRLSQARIKEEGSTVGLRPTRVKKIRATETMQKTQTISNKCGKRGDEGKERHHIYGNDNGPPDSNMKKLAREGSGSAPQW